MHRPLLSLVLTAGLATAALPAFAQSSAPASWKPLNVRQDQVGEEIAAAVDSGRLSDLQARDLRDQFKGLLDLQDQYAKTGLTDAQRADLEARYDTLEARIQVNSHPASIEVQRAPSRSADDQ